MRHFVIALFAITGLAISVAAAADLPTRSHTKAVPFLPIYNWSGFYVGAHIGSGWSNASFSDPTGAIFAPAGGTIGDNGSGFLGGLQFGYNWQTGNWVFGIQGDMSWTGINASAVDPFVINLTINDKVNWVATATGRIGYAWNNWLLYAKGGGAWVHSKYGGVGPSFGVSATGSDTRGGWVVGTGLEYGFTSNWTTFIEYDYIGLGSRTVPVTDPVFGTVQANIRQNIQMVKVGINYKFGGL